MHGSGNRSVRYLGMSTSQWSTVVGLLGLLFAVPGLIADLGGLRRALAFSAVSLLGLAAVIRAVELARARRLDRGLAALVTALVGGAFWLGTTYPAPAADDSGRPPATLPDRSQAHQSPPAGSGGPATPPSTSPAQQVNPTSPAGSTATPPPTGPPTGKARYLADLPSTGGGDITGTWLLNGHSYSRSLGVTELCNNDQTVTYRLGHPADRFIATVGVPDDTRATDQDTPVWFYAYADRDGDGAADPNEQVGTRSAEYRRPGVIDVPLGGATQLILFTSGSDDCFLGTAVWGDARVYP